MPDWARRALIRPVSSGTTTANGAQIAYRLWEGDPARGVLLLHGGGAHSRWWDFVAPLLDGRRVVAADFSGHGDSGWRPSYGHAVWVAEVADLARTLFETPPVVVGHSMGGAIGMMSAALPGLELAGVVAVDSPLVRLPEDEPDPPFTRRSKGAQSREELMERFRPTPDSGRVPPWLRRYVAFHSIRFAEGRYRWKFDPRFAEGERPHNPVPADPSCPVVYYHCEHGVVGPELLSRLSLVPGGESIEVREMPGVGHNPMLDIPVELADELNPLLDKLQAGVH